MTFLFYHCTGPSSEEGGNLVGSMTLLLSHLSITMLRLLQGMREGMRKG